MTDYRPVDCALHSEYELAIIQRRRLHMTWLGNDATTRSEDILPADLYARQGEEYMVVNRSDGQVEHIRLDRIIQVPSGLTRAAASGDQRCRRYT